MMAYDVGDMVRFGNYSRAAGAAPFTAIGGTATDPDVVTLVIVQPDGTRLTYGWPTPGAGQLPLTKEAGQTGCFYADVVIDQAGVWRWHLAGSGAVTAAAEGDIWVPRSNVV